MRFATRLGYHRDDDDDGGGDGKTGQMLELGRRGSGSMVVMFRPDMVQVWGEI